MTKYNLSKIAASSFQNYSKMIEEQTKNMGLSTDNESKNVNLKMPIKDNDSTVPFETQLEASRKGNDSTAIVEKSLDKEKKLYNDKRSDVWGSNVMPINLVSESYDQEKERAIIKAETKKETAFWDKYVGVQIDNSDRNIKVDNNIPATASQLQNKPERFKGLDKKNPVDSGVQGKADDMVMASLKKADAMLFHVYATASKEGREVNKKEFKIIKDVNRYKEKVLAQGGYGFEEGSSAETAPYEEDMTIENTKFELLKGPNGEGQLTSKIDGRVVFDLPDYESAKLILKEKGVQFDIPGETVTQPSMGSI